MPLDSPIVELKQGLLVGRALETAEDARYFEFKGIPYAKPPVGELRFKAPQPPEPWHGVRDGTKNCNVCAQYDNATSKVAGEEDCLYLNVFTSRLPTVGGDLLPVMFYIHGGGFIYGSGTDVDNSGQDYLIAHNVVVVSINYRLGVLGFLCLDIPDAQGNMGLKDQVQALKWVQENISQFGGDSSNVTIFGVSAGGASVEYLQLSPMARGLFHKAIIQSGSALNPWARSNSSNIKKLAFQIAKRGGKSISGENELLKYLQSLSVKELSELAAAAIAADEFKGGIHFGFVPTVEKSFQDCESFLSEPAYDLLKRGEFTKVPLISGFCRREGLLMIALAPQILAKIIKEKQLARFLPFDLDDKQTLELEQKLKLVYLDGTAHSSEEDEFAIDFFTDVDFLGGLWVATMLKARVSSPTYLYEFAYDGNLNFVKKLMTISRHGACHGDDSGYLLRIAALPDDVSKTDKLVRERIVRMWTNFAKFGEPTRETCSVLHTEWRPLTEGAFGYLEIGDQLTMRHSLHPQRLNLFEHLYEKYTP